jgi:cytoskeleton protein RodZ
MSDSGVNDQPVSHEPEGRLPKASPGERLAALREERGWTVEQVASQLNLAPRQILAIECDDYPSLPGMAIVRGFVRAYAKLLKVDAAPLLADLGGATVLVHDSLMPQKSLSTPFADSRMPSMTERPGLSSKWVVGALLLVLVGVGIWATRQGGDQTAVPAAVSSAANEGAASMPGANENKPYLETKAESTPTPPAESGTPAAIATEVQPQVAPAVTPSQPVASDAPFASGKDTFQLTAREESWVEIRRNGDNRVLLSRIVKPGETETIQLTEPVSVVIGNATGVDMTLRGSPMELKAGLKNNVARLTVK